MNRPLASGSLPGNASFAVATADLACSDHLVVKGEHRQLPGRGQKILQLAVDLVDRFDGPRVLRGIERPRRDGVLDLLEEDVDADRHLSFTFPLTSSMESHLDGEMRQRRTAASAAASPI